MPRHLPCYGNRGSPVNNLSLTEGVRCYQEAKQANSTPKSDVLRGAFMAQYFLFTADMFVWVDETGSDAWAHIRRYGYALRGMRAVCTRLLSRGKRINAMAGIATSRLGAVEMTESSVNAEFFFDFARGCLIPNMLPFNGSNPRSIVVMDNLTVHHVHEIRELFTQSEILVLLLPPTAQI